MTAPGANTVAASASMASKLIAYGAWPPAWICFIGRNGGTGDIADVTNAHLTAVLSSKADASSTAHAGIMMLIENRDLSNRDGR
jgi:hypothetical protein